LLQNQIYEFFVKSMFRGKAKPSDSSQFLKLATFPGNTLRTYFIPVGVLRRIIKDWLKFRHSASKKRRLRQKQSSDTRRKNIQKMSKNHLTEGKVCAAAALHTRVFGVRRAAANEGIFIPHLVLYVLRSNCPTLPVKLDYPFETINGLYKTEVIWHRGPWRNISEVEFATLEWVDWFNNRRLLEPIGDIPPAEFEMAHYRQLEESANAA
jgi:hypothetical protein